MPRTRQASRFFDIESLPNEVCENILSNFSLNELMTFECVSKRWQRNVFGTLKQFTTLTVITDRHDLYHNKKFCNVNPHHLMASSATLLKHGDYRTVIKLLTKMTNLVAVYLPDTCRASKDIMTALANCSKLEHLFLNVFEDDRCSHPLYEIPNEMRSKLTCLSVDKIFEENAIKDFPSLKYFECCDHVSVSDVTSMLNNGLIGLTCFMDYKIIDTVCHLGSRLEILDIDVTSNLDDFTNLNANDVRQLVRSLPRLKRFRADLDMDGLATVKDFKCLEELQIACLLPLEGHLFKVEAEQFGRRLKSLKLDSIPCNSLVKQIVDTCPNLEILKIFNVAHRDETVEFEISQFVRLSKSLKILRSRFLFWTEKDLIKLLTSLPNLQELGGETKLSKTKFKRFNNTVKKSFPKLFSSIRNFII